MKYEASTILSPEEIEKSRKKDQVEKYPVYFQSTKVEWGERKEIEFIGISHVPETFNQYRPAFEESIKNADEVILEIAPSALNILSEENKKKMIELAELHGIAYEVEKIFELAYHLPSIKFFYDLETMVREAGKTLVIADPITQRVSTSFEIGPEQINIEKLKEVLLYVGLLSVGVAGSGLTGDILVLIDKINKSQNINRRDFLRLSGSSLMVASSLLIQNLAFKSGHIGSDQTKNRVRDGAAIHSSRDYRDVTLAAAIDSITESNKKILAIYGRDHLLPTQHYLRNPMERNLKFAGYNNYKTIAPPIVSRYIPHGNRWEKQGSTQL